MKGILVMNWHIILTRRCNLNCSYCHGREETSSDTEIEYSLSNLEEFLAKDEDIQLMFYGGEPLLRIPLMIEIMDKFPSARFMLQTNALLLTDVPSKYIKKFHSILVSIDGPEKITDGYRSSGVYSKVLKNVQWLKEIGFEGDVVARMAISQQSDIHRDVRHLLEVQNQVFNHVHWQLNVVWDAEGNWTDFDKWVSESYNPGITQLVSEWVSKMETGVVEGIVPFIPLMHSLLTGQSCEMRCGSGLDTLAIHIDGRIGICPISPDWDFSIVGDIWKTESQQLANVMKVDAPCPTCDVYGICGGRCLFANKQRLWGQEGFEKICDTVKHLIGALKEALPAVNKLLKKGTIKLVDFKYPEFNNGCEIIP
ncbi:MAG: TIGR04084 family radical SAM/SPASM domain-containing protein [Candidatus Thorarchaeota archaeon]